METCLFEYFYFLEVITFLLSTPCRNCWWRSVDYSQRPTHRVHTGWLVRIARRACAKFLTERSQTFVASAHKGTHCAWNHRKDEVQKKTSSSLYKFKVRMIIDGPVSRNQSCIGPCRANSIPFEPVRAYLWTETHRAGIIQATSAP